MNRYFKYRSLFFILAFSFIFTAPFAPAKMVPSPEVLEMNAIVQSETLSADQKIEQLEEYFEQHLTSHGGVLYRIAQVDEIRARNIALRLFRKPTTTREQKYDLAEFLLRPYVIEHIPEFISEYKEFLVDAIVDDGKDEFCIEKTATQTAVGQYSAIAGGIGSPKGIPFSKVADPRVIPILIDCLSAPDHVYPQHQGCIRRGEPGEPSGRNTQRQGIPLALSKLGAQEAIPQLKVIVQTHHDINFRFNAAYALGRLSTKANIEDFSYIISESKDHQLLFFYFGKGLVAKGDEKGIPYLSFKYSTYYNDSKLSAVLYMTEERLALLNKWKNPKTENFYRHALKYEPLQSILHFDPEKVECRPDHYGKNDENGRYTLFTNTEQVLVSQESRIVKIYDDILSAIVLNGFEGLIPLIEDIESKTRNAKIRDMSTEKLNLISGSKSAHQNKANQRVDLTVKTPVESGEAQGTAGHP